MSKKIDIYSLSDLGQINLFEALFFLVGLGGIEPSFSKMFVRIKLDQTCIVCLSYNRFSINAFPFSKLKP